MVPKAVCQALNVNHAGHEQFDDAIKSIAEAKKRLRSGKVCELDAFMRLPLVSSLTSRAINGCLLTTSFDIAIRTT